MLSRTQPLEVRTSLPVEQARARLMSLSAPARFPLMNTWTQVDLAELSDHATVRVVRQRGRNLKALVEGELRADAGGGTVFSGHAAVDPITWYAPMGIVALFVPWQLWSAAMRVWDGGDLNLFPMLVGMGVFVGLMLGFLGSFAVRNRGDLAGDVRKALVGASSGREPGPEG